MKCNRCWKDFEIAQPAYVTTCSHIFCEECARDLWQGKASDYCCPLCDTPLTQRAIVGTVMAVTADKVVQLCGLPPRDILSICTKAIDFWVYQTETIATHENQERQRDNQRIKQLEEAFSAKLDESQSRLATMKKRYDSLSSELEQTRAEAQEAHAKCVELTRQKRKLEELYENSKRGVFNTPSLSPNRIQQNNSQLITSVPSNKQAPPLFQNNMLLPPPQPQIMQIQQPNRSNVVPSFSTPATPSGTPLHAPQRQNASFQQNSLLVSPNRSSVLSSSSILNSPKTFGTSQYLQSNTNSVNQNRIQPSPKFFSFKRTTTPTQSSNSFYYRR